LNAWLCVMMHKKRRSVEVFVFMLPDFICYPNAG
jgi:hypothetical protein